MLELVADEAVEELVRDRQKLERAVRDDDGVVVAGRDAGHGALAVAAREMLLARDEELGLRIELQEFRAPLLDQMVGHHEHGLLGQPHAAHFHGGGRHGPGLSRADDMGEQRAAALQGAPDRVLLVGSEVMVAQLLADHAGQGQMRAVEFPQADVVEAVVVLAGEPGRTLRVFPDPFAEPVLELLLFLARGDGFLLIDHARAVFALVIGGRRAAVEGILDEVGRAKARSAEGRGVGDAGLGGVIGLDGPGGDRLGVSDADALRAGVERMGDEVADIGCRYPGGAEPCLDVARLEIRRLHGFEGFDIAAIRRIERGGGLGCCELDAHIAAQIPVGGLPAAAFGIAIDEAAKFVLQLPSGAAGDLLHPRPVDLAGLVERDGEGFGGRLDMLDRPVPFERPPFENGGLGGASRFRVVVFEREQKRLVGVARESLDVVAGRDGTEPAGEGVIDSVEPPPGLDDLVLGRIVKLGLEHAPCGVAHAQHAANARGNPLGQVGGFKALAGADDKSAALLGEGSVLDRCDISGRRWRHVGRRARSFAPDENVAGKRRDGLGETRRGQLAYERGLAASVHRAFEAHLSQHHVGMAHEIFVDGNRAVLRLDGREVEPCVWACRRSGRALLQQQNIGRDFRAGVGLEGGIGEPDGADEVGAVGEIAPDGGVLLVHGVAAGHKRHDAARTELVERPGEKIVVNGPRQGRLAAVGGVVNGIVAEGNVADHHIEVIVGQRCVLEPFGENARVGIETLRDAGGDPVQFDAGPADARQKLVRHESEEMADAHRRLENLSLRRQDRIAASPATSPRSRAAR